MGRPCGFCDKNASLKCSNCQAVNYCGRGCQKLHWKQHKGLCEMIQKNYKKWKTYFFGPDMQQQLESSQKTKFVYEAEIGHINITILPPEILVLIFNFLSLEEIVICSNVNMRWREVVAQYFMQPHICRIASEDDEFKSFIEKGGWTSKCQDTDKIHSLYESQKCMYYLATNVKRQKF